MSNQQWIGLHTLKLLFRLTGDSKTPIESPTCHFPQFSTLLYVKATNIHS